MVGGVTAPTMHEARRAAGAVAEVLPRAEVMVFGSVARGEATEDSDIDLLVLVADLDYSRRLALVCGLKEVARRASETEVDVVVRDMPEWIHRTAKVRTSLERQAAADAVVIVPGQFGPEEINWGKEIGMPLDCLGEALGRLNDVLQAVCDISSRMPPDRYERAATAEGDETELRMLRRMRWFAVCGHAHMACEQALKAMYHLIGETAPPSTHNLQQLCDRLGVPAIRGQVEAALDAVRVEDRNFTDRELGIVQGLVDWRTKAHYGVGPWEYDHKVTAGYVRTHCEVALGLAQQAASCSVARARADEGRVAHSKEDPRTAARLERIALDVAKTLVRTDMTTGRPDGARPREWFTPFAAHLPPE